MTDVTESNYIARIEEYTWYLQCITLYIKKLYSPYRLLHNWQLLLFLSMIENAM